MVVRKFIPVSYRASALGGRCHNRKRRKFSNITKNVQEAVTYFKLHQNDAKQRITLWQNFAIDSDVSEIAAFVTNCLRTCGFTVTRFPTLKANV